ncbi:MAG: hypothetical protein NTW17_01795 [Candidatus Pacearchaeota archaeon]|nr:hypothetical protein [Candidatus Pacearchaeota archaeon]
MSLCRTAHYQTMYRDVFVSPLDYDIACCDALVAELNRLAGKPLTGGQIESIRRLEKLESLGGLEKFQDLI